MEVPHQRRSMRTGEADDAQDGHGGRGGEGALAGGGAERSARNTLGH